MGGGGAWARPRCSGCARRRRVGVMRAGYRSTPSLLWHVEAVGQSGVGAPCQKGSRTVASSTPVRFRIPFETASPPGNPRDEPTPHVRWKDKPVRKPVEIDSEEDGPVIARAAAIDVAKASGMVCTRVPHASKPGRKVTKVWEVDATTDAIVELAGYLAALGIERVVLEATPVIRGFQDRQPMSPQVQLSRTRPSQKQRRRGQYASGAP